jgi:hypothetical protein
MCDKILEFKPDLVITEKGVSDLAQHYFVKANVTAIRRVRKTDNNRIARAVGATIVNRVEDIRESDVGVGCGLFHIDKIGDEYILLETSDVDILPFLLPVIIQRHVLSFFVVHRRTSSMKLNEICRTPCSLLAISTFILNSVRGVEQLRWPSQFD